jgi:hypothetical protein
MADALAAVHEDILGHGYALTDGDRLGLPDPADVAGALSPALVPDPRGPGKRHARDVIAWGGDALSECASIAHGEIDDFSRFWLLHDLPGAELVAQAVLGLVPRRLRRPAGRMSADYFRYSPGTESTAHQDGFGDFVVIWVLDRTGDGGESFLHSLHGYPVLHRALAPGEILAFRDEMFLHGVSPLTGGGASRDALIFITLKDA